jgi:hypothetical protein
MTHFFAGFVIAAEALWLLWNSRRRSVKVAVGAVTVTQLALVPLALCDSTRGTKWIALSPAWPRIEQVPLEFAVNTVYRVIPRMTGIIVGAVLVIITVLLLVVVGDRSSRLAAALAASIATFGILLPLALAFLGRDYVIPRNLMAVWVPLSVALAAACAAPRARLAGGLVAAALMGMFVVATLAIQANPALQRPAWRPLARAVGASKVTRAVIAVGGSTARPLKLYLPGVSWTQPPTHLTTIREVDVIGTRRQALGSRSGRAARLPARIRVFQWVLERLRLDNPTKVSITQLGTLALRFFRRRPKALLIFIQQPVRGSR